MKPEDPAYLNHMLDAIRHIEDFSKDIPSGRQIERLCEGLMQRAFAGMLSTGRA
jgi:hypothetical protein